LPESFGGSLQASGAWGGEVVFVGFGLSAPDKGRDDCGGLALSGKVVVMLDGELPEGHALRTDGATLAARAAAMRKKGATPILTVISPENEWLTFACAAARPSRSQVGREWRAASGECEEADLIFFHLPLATRHLSLENPRKITSDGRLTL
jgi:hypothetical protein